MKDFIKYNLLFPFLSALIGCYPMYWIWNNILYHNIFHFDLISLPESFLMLFFLYFLIHINKNVEYGFFGKGK